MYDIYTYIYFFSFFFIIIIIEENMSNFTFFFSCRLTWWEYSWDIMEPVTYFVTYGTAMAAYAYYVLTKQVGTVPFILSS